jgi:hypothetical protein
MTQFSKTPLSILVILQLAAKPTMKRDRHPEKHLSLNTSTLAGMQRDSKLAQFSKAPPSILVIWELASKTT